MSRSEFKAQFKSDLRDQWRAEQAEAKAAEDAADAVAFEGNDTPLYVYPNGDVGHQPVEDWAAENGWSYDASTGWTEDSVSNNVAGVDSTGVTELGPESIITHDVDDFTGVTELGPESIITHHVDDFIVSQPEASQIWLSDIIPSTGTLSEEMPINGRDEDEEEEMFLF